MVSLFVILTSGKSKISTIGAGLLESWRTEKSLTGMGADGHTLSTPSAN